MNKEQRSEYNRSYYKKHRDEIRARQKSGGKRKLTEEQKERRRERERIRKEKYATDEYRDLRNARYKELHKDDVISKHGTRMREYFEMTTREQRAEERARKQAMADITEYLMAQFKITDKAQITEMLKDFYYQ